jgi:photosystem II stability/assembly factor-like uncharacterized protein
MLVLLLVSTRPWSPAAAQTTPAAPPAIDWEAHNAGLVPTFQVTALAVDPRDPVHLVAALYHPGGLLESWDSGRSWQPIPLTVPTTPTAAPTTTQPTLPLYTLLFEDGHLLLGGPLGLHQIALPTDRRLVHRPVTPIATWPAGQALFALERSPTGELYAAGSTPATAQPALWRRAPNGAWQQLTPLPAPAAAGNAILSVLATADRLFVGLDGAGLFVSEDEGATWQPVAPIGETFVAKLWAAPWDDDLLLARTRRGLWRSADGGRTWQPSPLADDVRVDSITAYGETGILLGLGDGSLRFSNDEGRQWQPWGSSLGRGGLFYTLTVAPDSGVTLLAGTEYGLSRSVDGGLTWQRVQIRGIPRTFYPLSALAQTNDGVLYLGSHDGVYRLLDGGDRWQPWHEALPRQRVLALATTVGNESAPPVIIAGSEVGLFRRSSTEAHWRFLGWEGSVPGLLLDPTDPNRLYLRAAFERVYATDALLSDNPGETAWRQQATGMALTSEILALAVDPTAPQVLYAGGAVELFKSEDSAATWQRIDRPPLTGQSIFALLVDGQRPEQIFAGATAGLYRSDDGGATWQQWGDDLPEMTFTALAQHPTIPALFVAGTKDNGLWISVDGGARWQQVSAVGTGTTVHALLIEMADPVTTQIHAATDRGFWRGSFVTTEATAHP